MPTFFSSTLRCRRAALWLVAAMLASGSGCRALRCRTDSDDSIVAARQLALQGIDAQPRGQWEQAENLFAAAVSQCPRDERARHGYAETLWRRGAGDEALAHMEEAVRLSGHDPERLVQLGWMLFQRGETTRAEAQAERAIAANPQLAAAWALKGDVQRAQGQSRAALATYHRALALQQPFPAVQLAVAELYAAENRPQRALATLQLLAESFPPGQTPPDVLVRQALALRSLGRHQDSARTLLQVVAHGPAPADWHYELARSQALAGETAAARIAVAAALARDPQHAGALALEQELGGPAPALAAAWSAAPSPH